MLLYTPYPCLASHAALPKLNATSLSRLVLGNNNGNKSSNNPVIIQIIQSNVGAILILVLGLERRWTARSRGHGKQGGWCWGDGGQLALRQPRDGRQGDLRGPWTQAHVCYRGPRRREMLG